MEVSLNVFGSSTPIIEGLQRGTSEPDVTRSVAALIDHFGGGFQRSSSTPVVTPVPKRRRHQRTRQDADELSTAMSSLRIRSKSDEEKNKVVTEKHNLVRRKSQGHIRTGVMHNNQITTFSSAEDKTVAHPQFYIKFTQRMDAVDQLFPTHMPVSGDGLQDSAHVVDLLVARMEKDKEHLAVVSVAKLEAIKQEIYTLDRLNARAYLKLSGIILEPILNRLDTIHNNLCGCVGKRKQVTPFEQALEHHLSALRKLQAVDGHSSGIQRGKNLKEFCAQINALKQNKEMSDFWRVIQYAFGNTADERKKVLETLKLYSFE